MKVAIIGGGLAGTSCAYVLKKNGVEAVIYEAGGALAGGASGNPLGLYNPRFSAQRTPQSDFYVAGFSAVSRTFRILENIDWNPCGSLHLINDEKKEKRFPQTLKNWGWDADHMKLVSAGEASKIAGVDVRRDALYLRDAGYVSPVKLCHAYAKDVDVRLGRKIEDVNDVEADAVILASASGVKGFAQTAGLPLTTVRGQVTQVKVNEKTRGLKCNLCYGGYFSPAVGGVHTLGATFQRWLDHDETIEEDNQDNIEKLEANMPGLAAGLDVVGERASVRSSTKDYFPIVGPVPERKNLYVSTGHGSHGVISTLISATLLADFILDRPRSLPSNIQQALSVERFM